MSFPEISIPIGNKIETATALENNSVKIRVEKNKSIIKEKEERETVDKKSDIKRFVSLLWNPAEISNPDPITTKKPNPEFFISSIVKYFLNIEKAIKRGRLLLRSEHVHLSGTKVREMLSKGERPPMEFSRPEIADILIGSMKND